MIDSVAPASHLRIAVPAYTGQISVQTAHSVNGAVGLLLAAGVKVDTDYLGGCCYLDHARNVMVDSFLRSEATDLLFVDGDVAFDRAALLRIVGATRPVIAGVYPKKSQGEQEWPVSIDAPEIWSDRAGNIECAMVPTGFLRINRMALEEMAPHVQEYEYMDGRKLRAFFKTEIIDGLYWGEDAWFCRRYRELSGKVYAMAEAEFGHVGVKEWRGKWPPNKATFKEAA